jgi:endoglycosylceramidase
MPAVGAGPKAAAEPSRRLSPRPAVALGLLIALVALGSSLVALGSSPALAASAVGASAGGWAADGIVQALGGPFLTDSAGRRLELHGVNLVAKCGGGAQDTSAPGTPCVGPAQGPRLAFVLSPTAADPGRRFTVADARTLAGLGFNTVRLGIVWEGLEPGSARVGPNDPRYCAPHRPGTPFPLLGRADPYDPATVHAYLRRTDAIVALLAGAGIRVILDMHSDVWGSAFSYAGGSTPWNGEGAPPWATCTGHNRLRPVAGWGGGYFDRAVQTAIHHFWANDVRADLQGQYARVWQAVAGHYHSDPDVIGYEVFNEPNDFLVRSFDPELECDYGGPVHEPRSCALSHTAALPDGLIGAIQAADPDHVVFYEPSGGTDFGARETIGIAEPLRFPRLALAFHVYGAIPAQLRETLSERSHTRTDQPGGPPWIMDEFGASNNATASGAAAGDADGMNLSWAYWSVMQMHDPTGGSAFEGLLDQQTRQPYPPMAQALALPYAWATAGRPGPQSFDRATGTYRYRYAVDPAVVAPTQIELPRYTYPLGYSVSVTGGRVTSQPGAALLQLRADRAAARVSVTVRSLSAWPFPRY